MTLHQLASRHGMSFGCSLSHRQLQDPRAAGLAAREFGVVEPENELKFEVLRPEREAFDFTKSDAILAFASSHGLQTRGHTLVWHQQVSPWARAIKEPVELRQVLKDHIFEVMTRHRGMIRDWDIVNEAVKDDGSRRSTIWCDEPGIGLADREWEYVAQAFHWAHEADPEARLFYNDYSIEAASPKTDAVVDLASWLLREGAPIHGIGIQAHMDGPVPGPEAWQPLAETIRRFRGLGLEVQITELDIRLTSGSPEALAAQQDAYCAVVRAAREAGATLVQLWGTADRDSWIPRAFPGTGWALPWDEDFNPKPAYEGLREALLDD